MHTNEYMLSNFLNFSFVNLTFTNILLFSRHLLKSKRVETPTPQPSSKFFIHIWSLYYTLGLVFIQSCKISTARVHCNFLLPDIYCWILEKCPKYIWISESTCGVDLNCWISTSHSRSHNFTNAQTLLKRLTNSIRDNPWWNALKIIVLCTT